jgi:hypothetical protein
MLVYLCIWNSAVNGIVITLRVERGSIPSRGKVFLSSSKGPDRCWNPPSLLCNGHRGAVSPE